ncbi:MAG: Holliday junction resolvase RuvX [Clostridia bacterium]|nr:Holliday junction resolvase RuvX [Clostridia bacterium]
MRVLSVDYGDVRTGLAISDLLGIIASPLPTFKTKSMRNAIDYVSNAAKEHGAEKIVVGLPLNMDGSEGERAQKTKAFGRVLERVCGISVIYEDERLTSVEAESILSEGNVKRAERKQLVDSMAARLILQSYLDRTNK